MANRVTRSRQCYGSTGRTIAARVRLLVGVSVATACGQPTPVDEAAVAERSEPVGTSPSPATAIEPAPASVAVPEVVKVVPATPGEPWTSPTLGAMPWVPPGTFTMGSAPTEPGRFGDETPHEVTLTRGWWMMEREVTHAMWTAVMGSEAAPSRGEGDDPLGDLSWEAAQAFAARASAHDGVTYRLPTEAEWEWAARGAEAFMFAGSDDPQAVGWIGSDRGVARPGCQRARNGYGLCDMTGNLSEWVADWYARYGTEPVTDPVGPPSGAMRVIRGGNYGAARRTSRVARRDETEPSNHVPVLGVRLVRAPDR